MPCEAPNRRSCDASRLTGREQGSVVWGKAQSGKLFHMALKPRTISSSHIIKKDHHETIIDVLSGDEGAAEYCVREGAQLTLILVGRGQYIRDYERTIRLVGRGAEAIIIGLIDCRGESALGLRTMQRHEAPDTRSNLMVKTVLRDKAAFRYHGVIRIEKLAQKSDAYQRNENLLLSAAASARSSFAVTKRG